MRVNGLIVSLLVFFTAALIYYFDVAGEYSTVYILLKTALQVFLLGWCAYLIISHFYESDSATQKIISIKRKSDHFATLAFYGIIVSIAIFALLYHYGDLFSFDSILISTFLLYFLSQVVQNSYPKVLISKTHIGYSDYASTFIPWEQVRKVKLETQLLTIQTNNSEQRIPLSGMEDISSRELSQELAAEILDGSIASESTSSTLSQLFEHYAKDRGFDLESKA